jgi:hypothetical protein
MFRVYSTAVDTSKDHLKPSSRPNRASKSSLYIAGILRATLLIVIRVGIVVYIHSKAIISVILFFHPLSSAGYPSTTPPEQPQFRCQARPSPSSPPR